jgi:hypothetical protein
MQCGQLVFKNDHLLAPGVKDRCLVAGIRNRFIDQGFDTAKSMFPLLPRFEFELMVLENASNDLVFAFRDVHAPPALTSSKLSNNGAKLNTEVVSLSTSDSKRRC